MALTQAWEVARCLCALFDESKRIPLLGSVKAWNRLHRYCSAIQRMLTKNRTPACFVYAKNERCRHCRNAQKRESSIKRTVSYLNPSVPRDSREPLWNVRQTSLIQINHNFIVLYLPQTKYTDWWNQGISPKNTQIEWFISISFF